MPMDTPTDAWPHAAAAENCAAAADLMADTERYGETYQLLAIRDGKIILELCGEGKTPDSTSVSWSMAKSWLHALVGVAIHRGVLPADLHRPVREYWSRCPAVWGGSGGGGGGDARGAITMNHLLTMRPNLRWREDYVDGGESDVIPMLSGYGGEGGDGPARAHSPPGQRCAESMGVWAASMPATSAAPGAVFNYSSGVSNIVSDILTTALCPSGGSAERRASMLRFFEEELAGPIGCGGGRLQPKFDSSGTFVGSSWLYGTARDFARLPVLYLCDGCWAGRRLLPKGWAESASTVTAPAEEEGGGNYAAHWWVDGHGAQHTFSCNGYNVQRAIAVPRHDLVVVRLGVSPDNEAEQGARCVDQLSRVIDELCAAAPKL